jgi:hypothetical protein
MNRWMLILFVAFILIFQSFWTGDGDVGFYVWFCLIRLWSRSLSVSLPLLFVSCFAGGENRMSMRIRLLFPASKKHLRLHVHVQEHSRHLVEYGVHGKTLSVAASHGKSN